jgi:hypothetical protein
VKNGSPRSLFKHRAQHPVTPTNASTHGARAVAARLVQLEQGIYFATFSHFWVLADFSTASQTNWVSKASRKVGPAG